MRVSAKVAVDSHMQLQCCLPIASLLSSCSIDVKTAGWRVQLSVLCNHFRSPSYGVFTAAQTAAVTAKMGESMAKASEAMAAMGQTNDPAKIAQTMQQFQKENAKMEMGQEMMDDNLDGIFDDDDTEAETSDLMNQVSIPAHQHIKRSRK